MTLAMTDDRERWNEKYRTGSAVPAEADPLLEEMAAELTPGYALDLAGGGGRNAIWLAQRGWRVVLTDLADEAIAMAAARSAEAGAELETRCESVQETMAWATRQRDAEGVRFDLILVFRFLVREIFEELPGLLKPGGLLLYKSFTLEKPRFANGDARAYALRPGELRTAFPALETVLYREADGVAELAARAR